MVEDGLKEELTQAAQRDWGCAVASCSYSGGDLYFCGKCQLRYCAQHKPLADGSDWHRCSDLQPSPGLAALKSDWAVARATAQTFREMLDARYAEMDAQIEALRQQFNADNAELIAEATSAEELARRSEQKLRAAIVDQYRATGARQLGHGLSVQVRRKPQYDVKAAEEWARKFGLCVVFDRKAFDKIAAKAEARAALKISFVEEVETPVAVIGKEEI